MNKVSKSLLVLFLAFLFGSCFSIYFAQAQDNKLILEVTNDCDIQYAGDSCIAELKLTNNTGKILDGKAVLEISYGTEAFDGEGIKAQFSIIDNKWLDFFGWKNGTTTVSNFEITKGETRPTLKIDTVPNLCPGKYSFNLRLQGTTTKEEYVTSPVVISGGGGYYIAPTTSQDVLIKQLQAQIVELQLQIIAVLLKLIAKIQQQIITILLETIQILQGKLTLTLNLS